MRHTLFQHVGETSSCKTNNLHPKYPYQFHSDVCVSFGFMLFVLINFPYVAVIAAIKKESNWKWALFTMVYTTIIAWVIAFLTYQVGSIIS